MTDDDWHEKPRNPSNPVVYFDITMGGNAVGRIQTELFKDIAPNITETFRKFCLGIPRDGLRVGYEGSEFHRVIKDFMIHAGNFVVVDGSNVTTNENGFDNAFIAKHTGAGLLSLQNGVPDANGYQFFITCDKCPWLDFEHEVFGRVVDGMDIVRMIENVDVRTNDHPKQPCIISRCGEIHLNA